MFSMSRFRFLLIAIALTMNLGHARAQQAKEGDWCAYGILGDKSVAEQHSSMCASKKCFPGPGANSGANGNFYCLSQEHTCAVAGSYRQKDQDCGNYKCGLPGEGELNRCFIPKERQVFQQTCGCDYDSPDGLVHCHASWVLRGTMDQMKDQCMKNTSGYGGLIGPVTILDINF